LIDFSEWRLGWSWPVILVVIAVMAICLRLCILTWIRSGRKKSTAWLEALRFIVVGLILVTLANPERVERIERDSEPEILLLADASGSMNTRDVKDANGTILTRSDWVKKSLAQPWRSELEKTAIVTELPFSSESGSEATDLSLPLQEGLDRVSNLKAALYFTDGDANTGPSPLSLAGRCRAAGVPTYVVRVGRDKPLPDLVLEDFTAPSFALLDERLTVSYRILNAFPERIETTLKLMGNDEQVAIKPIILPAGEEVSGTMSWLPTMKGQMRLRAELEEHPGESMLENNSRELETRIESKVLKALIVDSFPRWEYRFLRNALERDPRVDMNSVLLHPGMNPGDGRGYLREFPGSPEELAPYDVVFIGDIGLEEGELSEDDCEALANLVRLQASGVIFLPGRRGRQPSLADSPLGDLIPVAFDPAKPRGVGTSNSSAITLTKKGRNHWLTTLRGAGEPDVQFWERLPGFHWSAAALKSRPGSEVLAVHSIFRNEWGRMPVLAIRYVGAGKTLYLGSDSAWRWRRGVEDKYHYRFWSQIARWMAHGRHLSEGDGMKVIHSPERPKTGENVYLRCIVLDKDGFPLKDGPVESMIEHPGGETERLFYEPAPEGEGVFLATFRTRQSGTIKIRTEVSKADRFLETNLQAESHGLERLGRPARAGDLRELARLTGGKYGLGENLESIVQTIAALPAPDPLERIHRLRTDLNWGLFLCALLAIYWTGRKFTGMI